MAGKYGAVLTLGVMGLTPGLGWAEDLTYETFLARVEAQHPDAALDDLTIAERAATEKSRGLLPDPTVTLSYEEETLGLAVGQEIPWPGKRDAEKEVARKRTASAKVDARMARAQRRAEAARLYLDLVATSRQQAVDTETLAELNRVSAAITERRRRATASHSESLAIDLEREVLKATLAADTRSRRLLERRAAYLAGMSTEGFRIALEWPSSLVKVGAAEEEKNENLAITRIATERDAALATLESERRNWYPNLMVQGSLMRNAEGMVMPGIMLGARFPLFSAPVLATNDVEREQTANRYSIQGTSLEARQKTALSAIEEQEAQALENLETLRRRLGPMAAEHAELVLADFASGRAALSDVIEARRTRLKLRTAEIQTERALASARLQAELVRSGVETDVLDISAPRLSLDAMGGGSGMGGSMSSSMTSGNGGMSKMQRSPAKPTQPPTAPKSPDEEPAPGGSGGMGGMGGM